jgi:hypothetical protein
VHTNAVLVHVDNCVCTADFNPVCGIDGRTYGNPCAAACANVNVIAIGACATTTVASATQYPAVGNSDSNTSTASSSNNVLFVIGSCGRGVVVLCALTDLCLYGSQAACLAGCC